MADVINGNWIKARLTGRRGEKAELAAKLGLNPDKLSKVLTGQRRLSPEEIARVVEIFSGQAVPAPEAAGFAEGDVGPYMPPPRVKLADILSICRRIAPQTEHVSLTVASRDMLGLAIRRGDFLAIDMKPEPRQGDVVVCQLEEDGEAHTVLRQYLPPFLVWRDDPTPNGVIVETDPRIRILATVVGCFRAPQLAL
jgi:hypothetical protein